MHSKRFPGAMGQRLQRNLSPSYGWCVFRFIRVSEDRNVTDRVSDLPPGVVSLLPFHPLLIHFALVKSKDFVFRSLLITAIQAFC